MTSENQFPDPAKFADLKTEFRLPQFSLTDRIGLTQQGAGYVIEKLISVSAIKKTDDAKTNRKTACYVWIANEAIALRAAGERQLAHFAVLDRFLLKSSSRLL